MMAQLGAGFGSALVRSPHPKRPHLPCKTLACDIARPRKSEYLAALPPSNLSNNVSGCTKAQKTDLCAIPRYSQRAPADQACAHQWSRCDVIPFGRELKRKARIRDYMRRIASVPRITGKNWSMA